MTKNSFVAEVTFKILFDLNKVNVLHLTINSLIRVVSAQTPEVFRNKHTGLCCTAILNKTKLI